MYSRSRIVNSMNRHIMKINVWKKPIRLRRPLADSRDLRNFFISQG
jgi:hypothetical protein